MNPQQVCQAKRRYHRRNEAESDATIFTRRNCYGYKLRAYQCPVCGEWHLTKGGRR